MQWATPSTWLAMYLLSGPVQSLLRSKLVQKGSDVLVDAVFQIPSTIVSLFRSRKVWTSSELLWSTIESDMARSSEFLRQKVAQHQLTVESAEEGFEMLTPSSHKQDSWTKYTLSTLDQYEIFLTIRSGLDRKDPNTVQSAILILEQLHRCIEMINTTL